MKKTWLNGLTEEQAKEMEREFKEASLFKARLIQLIDDKKQTRLQEAMSKLDYENPNWPYKQADSIGFCRALDEIISLLK